MSPRGQRHPSGLESSSIGLLEHRGVAPWEHHGPCVLVGDPCDLDAPVSLIGKTEQLSEF